MWTNMRLRPGQMCRVLVPVLLMGAGCSAHGSSARPTTTVASGAAVTVTDPARHLTLNAGPDVIPPGTLTIAAPGTDLAAPSVHDAVSIDASGAGPVKGQIELHFRVSDGTPDTATAAYFEPAARAWLPVPSTRTGNYLVGTTSHLTRFGWFDDLRLVLGRATEVRGVSATEVRGVSATEVRGVSATEVRGVSATEVRGVSATEVRGVSAGLATRPHHHPGRGRTGA